MKKYLIITFVCLFSLFGYAQKTDGQHLKDAEKVATKWLTNFSTGKLDICWEMYADTVKTIFNFKDWENHFKNEVFVELGKFEKREFDIANMEKDLPGFDKGLYVTIVYKAKFKNTQFMKETIFLFLPQKNPIWKILSYDYEYQLNGDNREIPK